MSTIIKAPLARVLIIYGLGVAAAMCVSEAVTELGKIAAEFHPPSRSTIGWVMSMPSLIVALGALISAISSTGSVIARCCSPAFWS